MRITNKIMQNNSVYNINQNKILQDKLNSQITTRQKVLKPSDDPVTAIRSLRLRSNLNQVSQYYQKNIPDAENWLDLTESSITTTVDIVTDMINEFQRGSKGSLTTKDRQIILDTLKECRNEVYATGDNDYAGRTLFTGYRTDYSLSFDKGMEKTYEITEQLNKSNMETITYVDTGKLLDLNETNYDTLADTDQTDVERYQVHRMRLAYEDVDAGTIPTIQAVVGYDDDGNAVYGSAVGTVTVMPQAGATDPYVDIVNNPDAIYFVPETGDLLLGDNVYKNLSGLPADTEIRIDYNKSKWADGDLRPEHYFSCSSDGIDYNKEYLTKDGKNNKQVITFDVGFNQKLDVNITADKVYKHGIARTVDEMISYLEDLDSLDAVVKKLEAMVDDANYDQDMVSAKLEAAKKAQTYLSDTIQKKFEHGITQMQGYLDDTNAALTDVGNKGMRLKLIENRLSSQEESFTTLATKNDEADLAELAVHLSSAELTYNASLNATAKLLQTTLLNYI